MTLCMITEVSWPSQGESRRRASSMESLPALPSLPSAQGKEALWPVPLTSSS